MILLCHPTGNNFSRALVASLVEVNRLAEFVTCVAIRRSDWFLKYLPDPLKHELLRRSFDVPADRIQTAPGREIGRLLANRAGLRFLTRHETGWFCWEAVYDSADRFAAKRLNHRRAGEVAGVYCYEDAAYHTFNAAQELGIRRYYDLPIAYWEMTQRLLNEERERLPEWRLTLEASIDSPKKLERKTAELNLAEVVVCPSRFVLESLPAAVRFEKKCVVAEFGSPPARVHRLAENRTATAPLRVLFAGSMTQRKGLADLFAAMRLLNRSDVELVVFGSPAAPMGFYRKQFASFRYEEPRPHAGVLALMATCDVLVLPSIVEGRALVQQEALSCGLPIIVTAHAGGEDLVDEGKTGFLLPIRSPDTIAARINWFADHRSELCEMRELCRGMAARYSWDSYADKVLNALN